MTCELYIESSISALQNRGGYRCHAIIDNPSDRIYHALSWLLAAVSAFVYIIHLACSARGLRIANGMPPICHLSPSEAHRNLIGTSSEPHRNLIGTSPKGYRRNTRGIYKGCIRDIILEQGLAQSDKGSLPLHFTPYTLH